MTDYQVALAFEDGVTRFITCAEDQTVADAAYRSRINIPVDCNDGACGTCKAFCESGKYDLGNEYVEDALSDAEAEEGYLLACQARPESDLVVQIASTSAVAKTQAATFTATVTDIHRFSDAVVRLRMTIPNRDKLAYLPGQYVNIRIPGSEETRSYSFSSDPGTEELEFLVKIVPGGLMSTWLTETAAVGDEVTFNGPHGSFFLREALRPVLMVAGGTGLAPMLAMLRKVAGDESGRAFHLVYGVNTDDEVVELDTLRELEKQIPHFTWDYCVLDESSECPNHGYVMTIIGPERLHAGDSAVYLCGPPPMVEAVRTHLNEEIGIEPTGFYYEKFTSAAPTTLREEVPAPVVGTVAEETDAEAEPEAPEASAGQARTSAAPAASTVAGSAAAAEERLATAEGAAGFQPVAREVREMLYAGDEARSLLGQALFPTAEVESVGAGEGLGSEDPQARRELLGQELFVSQIAEEEATPLDPDSLDAPDQAPRQLLGQELFPAADIESVGGSEPAGIAASFADAEIDELLSDADRARADAGGNTDYEIGEEHPSITRSDAIFEARQALELGALELVMGRVSSQQLAGYRLLAEATLPYVHGETFTDAMAYNETNAAFHDYLFSLTGNDHLRQAYERLGIKGAMDDTLRHARWCHPLIAKDHVDMVEAIEAGRMERARQLFMAHAERAKLTMRRAMSDRRPRPVNISPGRFENKVVLITGAAQGIGEAVARRIHAEGGELVLADRSELVESLAAELTQDRDRSGADNKAAAILADLETFSGAESVVELAMQRFGRVDVAIHVVGGTIWRKPYEEYSVEEITAEISRSLFPTMWSCRAVLPQMYAQGHGTIVNVSSIATMGLNRIPYAAAKGGVNALTRSLAFEAADHGVRVVATAPGGTEAPPRRIPRGGEPSNAQEEAWHQTTVDQTIGSTLLKRYGTLDEQSAPICFLASDEASYLTGQVLPVGGGDLG